MTTEKPKRNEPPATPEPDHDRGVPKPPAPRAVKEISEQQGLLHDEWTGEGPDPDDAARSDPQGEKKGNR